MATIETWIVIGAGVLVLGVGGLLLARKDEILRWNTERRNNQRRQWERRAGDDRRGELRLNHDERVHNHNRRRAERREADRRHAADWKSHLESVRERIEDIQQDNRNR